MAQVIPSGNTNAVSADFTLASGDMTTIAMEPPGPGQRVQVQIKNGANYQTMGVVTDADMGVKVLQAPGTFRLVRPAQAKAFAVHRT